MADPDHYRSHHEDQESSTRLGAGQTMHLDLSDDDDELCARRTIRISPQGAAEYLSRRYLDTSQRYDAIDNEGFKATYASHRILHIPDPVEGSGEGNNAIETLRDWHWPGIFHAYEQEYLGRVHHCMWCGVGEGITHKVDCRYLHHLLTERGMLQNSKAPALPTLLLEKGTPFPDIQNPDVEIDAHSMMISHLENTGQDPLVMPQDGTDNASKDDLDGDWLHDVIAGSLVSQLDRPFGRSHMANGPLSGFARAEDDGFEGGRTAIRQPLPLFLAPFATQPGST